MLIASLFGPRKTPRHPAARNPGRGAAGRKGRRPRSAPCRACCSSRTRWLALQRTCAKRAIALLRQAVAKGYQDAEHMKNDHDLKALRERDDFKKLVAELEAKAKKDETKSPQTWK